MTNKLLKYFTLDMKTREIKGTNDITEWSKFFAGERYIARTELPNGVIVSTVFLGLDHGFGDEGEPLIFETMIFGLGDDNEYQSRCSSWLEAESQHLGTLIIAMEIAGKVSKNKKVEKLNERKSEPEEAL